jgi:protein-S-isoprenylcysteine O-methyltransferase Ste14
MKDIRDALIRIAMFALVFLSWMWVLVQPFSDRVNLTIIVGAVLLVFPVVLAGRLLLDRDPDPEDAAWLTTMMHALLMVLFGAAIIRALGTYETWRGWLIPVPAGIGLALLMLTGALAAITVLNLALRGCGAPFGIALSRRLATDWLYAWTRNPMVLATLALLVSLGLWFQSGLFIMWVVLLVVPALLFFVKVFEERELEIRFGDPYRQYRTQTPMLLPRRPGPRKAAAAKPKPAARISAHKRPAAKSAPKRRAR